jgi:hypothetical protein
MFCCFSNALRIQPRAKKCQDLEIEHMRLQLGRQRKEILQLQRAGIPTASAEALLGRMHVKIDDLCAQRDRLKREQPARWVGAFGGRNW